MNYYNILSQFFIHILKVDQTIIKILKIMVTTIVAKTIVAMYMHVFALKWQLFLRISKKMN